MPVNLKQSSNVESDDTLDFFKDSYKNPTPRIIYKTPNFTVQQERILIETIPVEDDLDAMAKKIVSQLIKES